MHPRYALALLLALACAAALPAAGTARRATPGDPLPTTWQPVGATVDGSPIGNPTVLAGRVNAVAIVPGTPPVEIVGTYGGIWRRVGTAAWTDVTAPSWPSTAIDSLAVDPLNTNVVYAGTGGGDTLSQAGMGVLKSTDAGATWTPLAASVTPLRGYAVMGLAVDPLDDGIVVAAAQNGLFRSTDGGATWSEALAVPPGPFGVAETRLAVDPVTGVMLAGVAQSAGISAGGLVTGHAIFRSADGGQTWTPVAVDGSTDPGEVVAPGIATSGGTTYAYALDITDDAAIGLYTSSDGGQHWTFKTADHVAPKADIAQLVVDPAAPTKAYFGQESGPFRYTWGSTTVAQLTSSDGSAPQFGDWRGLAIGPDPAGGKALYGGNDGGTCFFDLGAKTFTNNSDGLVAGIDFFGDAQSATSALAGAQDLGVDAYRGGATSLEVLGADAYGVLVDRSDPTHYLAGVGGPPDPAYESHDSGVTWTPLALPGTPVYNPYYLRLVQADGAPNVLIVPEGDGTLYVSSNDGASWTARAIGLTGGDYLSSVRAALIPDAALPVVYAGTGFGRVWRSRDLGASWTELGQSFDLTVRDIAIDAAASTSPSGEHVYLALGVFSPQWYASASTVGDVVRTTNSGSTWTDIGAALSGASVNALLLSGSTLLAGTDRGVEVWSGSSWSPAGSGFPTVRVNGLFASHDGQAFFATTWGRGLLEAPASTASPPVVTKLKPDVGPPAGGVTAVVTGTGFAPGATVRFGSTASSSVTFVSATKLKAVAPAHAAGSVDVTVTTGAGTSATTANDLFAYGPPTITSFTPASAITGKTVTITGTAFAPGLTATFGTLASPSVKVVSGTSAKAVVPNGAVAGPITVADAQGQATSSSAFTPTLSVTSLAPSSGPPGTVVTIGGIGFKASSAVAFGGTAATSVTFVSSSQLRATVPAGAATGPVTVTNTTAPKGTVRSAGSFTVA